MSDNGQQSNYENFNSPATVTIKVRNVERDKNDAQMLCLYGIGAYRKSDVEGQPGTINVPCFKVKETQYHTPEKLLGATVTATVGLNNITTYFRQANPDKNQRNNQLTLYFDVFSLVVAVYPPKSGDTEIPAPSQPVAQQQQEAPQATERPNIRRKSNF